MSQQDEIATPTVSQVLAEFLAEQEQRLSPRTFKKYRDVVQLLEHCLDGYAYQSLEEREREIFDRLYDAPGSEHREFCQIFGPEHILPNLGEFLGYFMIRKVLGGKELVHAAGTVTRKLAKWLAEKGYADAESAEDGAKRAADAARDLPRAHDLSRDLYDFARRQPRGDPEEELEGYFEITRLEPRKMWLEDFLGGDRLGPIALPEELRRRCEVGWQISGVVGRVRGRWRLVEAWNVYPR